jgi:O-succinylbenzoic acid--CoA ligase
VIEWLRHHDQDRVFIETPDRSWTFGETAAAVEARHVSGTEVLRPRVEFDSVIDLLAVMSKGSAVIVGEESPPVGAVDTGGAATVVFTSGTAAAPKGVRLTLENWEAAARASMQHLGHGREDTWLLAMPLHHVGGLSILIRSAYTGGSVRLLPGFEPVSYARELCNGVTMASVVPTMLHRVLDADPGPYVGLRGVLVGGGPIPDGLLQRAVASGLPVLPTYGMTETCGQVATLRPGSPVEKRAHPLPGVELRIVRDGRIAVRAPMVSPGYLGDPDRSPGEWLVTGDLGWLDEEGALHVTGRADTVIVTGGENVAPETVEAALTGAPGLESAVVAGIASEEWGMEVVCLYVGLAEPARLESHLRERLEGFMIPKQWKRVAVLPMTSLGKPDRAGAARMFS